MQTHALQFGKHVGSAGHAHSRAEQIGGRFFTPHAKSSGNVQHDALVKQTEKWVSQTFYGEMLKQMRNSPFKNEKFEGGKGGEAFNQMFDTQMADKMSKGAGKKLVDSIVNKIEAKRAYDASSKTTRVPHKQSKAHSTPAFLAGMGMTR